VRIRNCSQSRAETIVLPCPNAFPNSWCYLLFLSKKASFSLKNVLIGIDKDNPLAFLWGEKYNSPTINDLQLKITRSAVEPSLSPQVASTLFELPKLFEGMLPRSRSRFKT